MKRRHIVGGLAAAAGIAACGGRTDGEDRPFAGSSRRFAWSMVTSWPPGLPGLGAGATRFAERITRASGGRLTVRTYAAGELVPAFEVFDAVSRGAVEMGHGAAYYHKGKVDAAPLFTTVPFGLNAQEMNGWLYYGGGLELWRELYAGFGLVPFPAGNTGVQMGGWFNRAIDSVEDLEGLKMRIPGLGGEVLRRAGGTPVTLPGAEIFTSLQTGAIDATEWVGPYNDLAFGLPKAARYYYYPGWQEPGATMEAIVNKDAWDDLPDDLKAIVEIAAQAANSDMLAEYVHGNAMALKQLRDDPEVEVRAFPADVIELLAGYADEVIAELVASDPAAAKIHASYAAYRKAAREWQRVSEAAYLASRG